MSARSKRLRLAAEELVAGAAAAADPVAVSRGLLLLWAQAAASAPARADGPALTHPRHTAPGEGSLSLQIEAIIQGIRNAGNNSNFDVAGQLLQHADTLSIMIAQLLGQPLVEPQAEEDFAAVEEPADNIHFGVPPISFLKAFRGFFANHMVLPCRSVEDKLGIWHGARKILQRSVSSPPPGCK